jgi:hypothetical protein
MMRDKHQTGGVSVAFQESEGAGKSQVTEQKKVFLDLFLGRIPTVFVTTERPL